MASIKIDGSTITVSDLRADQMTLALLKELCGEIPKSETYEFVYTPILQHALLNDPSFRENLYQREWHSTNSRGYDDYTLFGIHFSEGDSATLNGLALVFEGEFESVKAAKASLKAHQ